MVDSVSASVACPSAPKRPPLTELETSFHHSEPRAGGHLEGLALLGRLRLRSCSLCGMKSAREARAAAVPAATEGEWTIDNGHKVRLDVAAALLVLRHREREWYRSPPQGRRSLQVTHAQDWQGRSKGRRHGLGGTRAAPVDGTRICLYCRCVRLATILESKSDSVA